MTVSWRWAADRCWICLLYTSEKGAFTGASSNGSPGKFELADGGTIFLDEIGELPLEIQAKLLRVLDNHRVRRIGAKTEHPLDIRVIAATNRHLWDEVEKKNFRGDLYFRINVVKFNIPPLRAVSYTHLERLTRKACPARREHPVRRKRLMRRKQADGRKPRSTRIPLPGRRLDPGQGRSRFRRTTTARIIRSRA